MVQASVQLNCNVRELPSDLRTPVSRRSAGACLVYTKQSASFAVERWARTLSGLYLLKKDCVAHTASTTMTPMYTVSLSAVRRTQASALPGLYTGRVPLAGAVAGLSRAWG